ncbi:hypothetical protein LARV_02245 [Longilinea arvoryzae]|uniref:DUF2207 domain-containing protein n=1 Tax=Longilinea arvoryzae TaxID=360412 RepID=A0A0S7BKJ9_9CHLR|nr:hypothetical protein [Longilinea arvoryzae]GAP14475.1 hypothetical protein LARV_02245 [Longilinea arvoryzae]
MKRYRWWGILTALLLLVAMMQPVAAQSYYFQVPEQTVNFYIDADGTATVEYVFTFTNEPSGADMEFVDIGMPQDSQWSVNNATADLNGTAITKIAISDYIQNGVMIDLRPNAIKPGQTGKVGFRITGVKDVLFKADQQINGEDYASFNFQPNTFESGTVAGKTKMTVTLFLPPGLKQDEPRYYTPQSWPGTSDPNETGFDSTGGVYYRWYSADASTLDTYIFGGSFPSRLITDASAIRSKEQFNQAPVVSVSSDTMDNLLGIGCCVGFGALFIAIFYASIRGNQKRKLQYMPPKIALEGNGIKRGLTAVEAAILMEQPLDKVMTMILFSVLKKGAAEVVTKDPLKLRLSEPQPEDLRTYEVDFLKAMQLESNSEKRKAMQDVIVGLVKSVQTNMKGFSSKETVVYYKDIMKKAWEQVESAETPEVKVQKFDETMGWTMLDDQFNDRTQKTFGSGPIFVPAWWWRWEPSVHPTSFGGTSVATSGGSVSAPSVSSGHGGGTTISLPTLPGGSFAASVVGGIQSFSAGVVGDITGFTGGITSKTNPIPVSTGGTYRSTGGSGGHCACACACACAGCACACAGGGR